jgi:NAD(P)-dependent dehydrogenase (short-subunit alcohol dehydrogenase family)
VTEKAVIMTGAAGGLGRATSIAAARAGYAVLLVDRNEAGLAETAALVNEAGGKAVIARADVSKSDDVKAYVAKALDSFGRIDGLFNNAGILGAAGYMVDLDEADFDRVIAINLKGVFLGLKYVLPVMLRQGAGSIVNTGSMTSTGGVPGLTAYGATKYGVISLTKERRTGKRRVARQHQNQDGLEQRPRRELGGSRKDRGVVGAARSYGRSRGYRGRRDLSVLRRRQTHHRHRASGRWRHYGAGISSS